MQILENWWLELIWTEFFSVLILLWPSAINPEQHVSRDLSWLWHVLSTFYGPLFADCASIFSIWNCVCRATEPKDSGTTPSAAARDVASQTGWWCPLARILWRHIRVAWELCNCLVCTVMAGCVSKFDSWLRMLACVLLFTVWALVCVYKSAGPILASQ